MDSETADRSQPITPADAIADPDEERALLARVVWPSHEPLAFLRRRGGQTRNCQELYERYHQPENVAALARLLGPGGMYTIHFYKGMGLKHEAEEMARGYALSREMKRRGMAICVYLGGTMHTETMYKDHPEAREWACVATDGGPVTYMMYQLWRHFACNNNPGYRAFVRHLCDLALDEAGADLIWFDNNILRAEPRSCRCRHCLELFPRRVMAKYTESQRRERFGYADLEAIQPPAWSESWPPSRLNEINDPVIQEWIDFRCHTVYDFFGEMEAHIHARKPDCLVALNIKGVHPHNLCFDNGIDHGRWLLRLINSCDAGLSPRVGAKGNQIAEFRSFKLSHSTGLSIIDGHSDRGNLLGIVMNRQIRHPRLGCVPGNGHAMYTFGDLGRFLKTQNDHLYGQRPIYADVAVLRSWASTAYNSVNWVHGPFICEQGLWQSRIPFGIVFDRNLDDLSAHRVVLLANQDALSDAAVAKLKAFVEAGGGLVATDSTGARDDWRRQREVNALTEVFGLRPGPAPARLAVGNGRVAYLPKLEAPTEFRTGEALRGSHADTALPPRNWKDVEAALRWAAGGAFRFSVSAPKPVAAEFRQGPTPADRVVHLMNFAEEPVRGQIRVEMADEGRDWSLQLLSPDPLPTQTPTVKRARGRVSFALPAIGLYTACVLRPTTGNAQAGAIRPGSIGSKRKTAPNRRAPRRREAGKD
jgi:hypothetical protein